MDTPDTNEFGKTLIPEVEKGTTIAANALLQTIRPLPKLEQFLIFLFRFSQYTGIPCDI